MNHRTIPQLGMRADEYDSDGDKLDEKLRAMEDELDHLQSNSRVYRKRADFSKHDEIDHAGLIHRLLGNTRDPMEQTDRLHRAAGGYWSLTPRSLTESRISSSAYHAYKDASRVSNPGPPTGQSGRGNAGDSQRHTERELRASWSSEKEIERLRKLVNEMDKEMLYVVKVNAAEMREHQDELTRVRHMAEELHRENEMLRRDSTNQGRLDERDHDFDLHDLTRELESVRGEVARLVSALQAATADVHSKDGVIDILKASIADIEKQRIGLAGSVDRLEAEKRRMEEELDWVKDQLRQQQTGATVNELKYEIEQLRYIIDMQRGDNPHRTSRDFPVIGESVLVRDTPTLGDTSTVKPGTIIRGRSVSQSRDIQQETPRSKTIPPYAVDVLHSPTAAGMYRKRSVSPNPPWSLHEGIEAPPISTPPNHTSPMGVSRKSVGRSQPPWAVDEDAVQNPPTPNTPKPRAGSIAPEVSVSPRTVGASPKPHVVDSTTADVMEAELLQLNLERETLEGWLGKVPVYSAGRTLAERKEKYLRERRLAEVDRLVSELKLRLKEKKKERSHPMG